MATVDAGNGRNVTTIGPEYSTMSPFNLDNTRLLIQHFSYFALYDGDGNFLNDLYRYGVHASSEPRWSRTDTNVFYFVNGNQLKSFNIGTNVVSVVHAFSEYSSISGKGESDISFDGTHFVFCGNGRYVFVYDMANNTKGSVFDVNGHPFDSLYITPDNHVTITWLTAGFSRYNGIEMFDQNMNFLRQLAHAGGHMDVTRDTTGDEVLVWANFADVALTTPCTAGVTKIRLADGKQTCIWKGDWGEAVHVSGTDNSGWAFVETYSSRTLNVSNWTPYQGELLQVKLDGSEVRRLAHHRSRPFSGNTYTYMPKMSASRDGKKIVFASNYGLQSILGYPANYSDAYMIDLTQASAGTGGTSSTGTTTSGGSTSEPTGTPTASGGGGTAPSGGGGSATSSDTGSSISVGYARLQSTSGSTTPSGVAILDRRQNNVLVNEVGVPATAVLNAGRIYVEIGNSVETGLAIANPNNSVATISFYFTDTSGNPAGSGSTALGPNEQIAQFLDQPDFKVFPTPTFQGTFSFTSSVPVAVVALRGLTNERGEFLMSTLPVVDTSMAPGTGTIAVPHFADGGGWTTQVFLVNPTDNAMTGTLQFMNPAGAPTILTVGGQTSSTFGYSIPRRASQKFSTLGLARGTTSGSIRIVPDGGGSVPTPLVEFSYKPAGITVSDAGIPVISGNAFRAYVETSGVAGQAGGIESGIAIANVSSDTTNVTLEITDLNGAPVGGISPVTIALPGMGQTSKFLTGIFPSLPRPFKGTVRITAKTGALSIVGLRARINERGDFLITTTPPVNENAPGNAEMFFPQVADGGGYSTQFILFSGTPNQNSSGVLKFIKQDGTLLNLPLN